MVSFLDVPLENAGSGGLVEAGSFQDMGGIDPVVGLTAHDMLSLGLWASELELPYWILKAEGMDRLAERYNGRHSEGRVEGGRRKKADPVVCGRENAVCYSTCSSHDYTAPIAANVPQASYLAVRGAQGQRVQAVVVSLS